MTNLNSGWSSLSLASVALSLSVLVTACSSSSDTDDSVPSGDSAGSAEPTPVDDETTDNETTDGEAPPQTVGVASYCSAPELNSAGPSYVLFDLPAFEQFAELRNETETLADLAVLTQVASLASANLAIPGSRLFCDFDNAEANGCTMNAVPRSTVRDVFLTGSTLSFSVDTDDGQTTDFVIGSRDYSTASLASTTRNGSVFTLDTSRDSTGLERLQISRNGRTTIVSENPDCSGMVTSTEGISSALTAQWTSPTDSTLSLTYELCENGAAEGAGCTTGSLTVQ